jgi:hypothetical protein
MSAVEEMYHRGANRTFVTAGAMHASENRACQSAIDDPRVMTTMLTAAAFVAPGPVGRPTHELELHEALLGAAALLLPNPRYERVAILELSVRGARPDVVVADLDVERFEARKVAGLLPLTSTTDIAVRSVLRTASRQLTPGEIIDAATRYASANAARDALARYVRREAVVAGRRGFAADYIFEAAAHATHGVEAKIGNWRGAAQQAQRWRLYFDRAWLCFPDSYAGVVPLALPGIRMFGVASVTCKRRLAAIAAPPARRADPFNATLLEEYLYARWLKEKASSSRPLAPPAALAAIA